MAKLIWARRHCPGGQLIWARSREYDIRFVRKCSLIVVSLLDADGGPRGFSGCESHIISNCCMLLVSVGFPLVYWLEASDGFGGVISTLRLME